MSEHRTLPAALALIFGMLLLPSPGSAADNSVVEPTTRLALIIANSAYEGNVWSPLSGPRNDGRVLAEKLRSLGFEVDLVTDGDLETMVGALRQFRRKLLQRPGALAWFYYSGHGAQVAGARSASSGNYLIPARSALVDEEDAAREALAVDDVIDNILGGDPLAAVVVLDACRNNALPRRVAGSGLRGLAGARRRDNVLVAYSASAGQVASDGEDGTSPYASALVEQLGTPGATVSTIFKQVRSAVAARSGGRQAPEVLDRTEFEIVLTPAPLTSPPVVTGVGTGVLQVSVLPQSGRIYLNGSLVGSGSFEGRVAADEDLELRVRAEGFDDHVERVRLGEGKTLPVEVQLRKPVATTPQTLLGALVKLSPPGSEQAIEVMANEITVGQYRTFVDATGYRTDAERNLLRPGCWAHDSGSGAWEWRESASWRAPGFPQTDLHPVVCVSYNDLRHFAEWVHRMTGRTVRVPSEGEWHWMARARSGMTAATICEVANVADQTRGPRGEVWADAQPCQDGAFYTAPVRRYTPNRLGLFDIDGNVREWLADCWEGEFDPAHMQARATGQCSKRPVRGGDFQMGAPALDSESRSDAGVSFRSAYLGARLLVEP